MDRRIGRAAVRTPWVVLLGLGVSCAPSPSPESSSSYETLAQLDLSRSGRVVLRVVQLDSYVPAQRGPVVTYRIRSPRERVEDTEIRGMLDGTVKYPFNQATAYHMRVGRRYDGLYRGEFELKRSLLRFPVPVSARGAQALDAELTVWVESLDPESPLRRDPRPVHAYLYPLDQPWTPGAGGTERNSFSPAAPGETSWTAAGEGERLWPAPGALPPRVGGEPSAVTPVAVALLQGEDAVVFHGEALRRWVERRLREADTVDFLIKLDDDEEDRWGTELALLTSEFGDANDALLRRPVLELRLRLAHPVEQREQPYVIEAGGVWLWRAEKLPPGRLEISVEVVPDGSGVPPQVWIRGGPIGLDEATWQPAARAEGAWGWVEARLGAPQLTLGEQLRVELLETWVAPGPRQEQRPEMVLLAPSGRRHRVQGVPIDALRYRIAFEPDEPGLWRYAWSFLPRPQSLPGSHEGRGLVYVHLLRAGFGLPEFERAAEAFAAAVRNKDRTDPRDQVRFNALVRAAAALAYRDPAQATRAREILEAVRRDLPPRFGPWDSFPAD